jgi:hypothetical protein
MSEQQTCLINLLLDATSLEMSCAQLRQPAGNILCLLAYELQLTSTVAENPGQLNCK